MKFLLKNIDSIIFDLGGVVLNLKPENTINEFARITGFSEQEMLEIGQKPFFKQYEKGEISSCEFRAELKNIFGREADNAVIDTAWNAMLLDLPLTRLELIAGLRPAFKTFVLSNTNEIHISAFNQIVIETTGGAHINSYFDNVYYSHKVGLRKPDTEIFEMVIEKNNLTRAHTLFIDDTFEHIESAKSIGLQTWHLTNQDELFTVFGNE